MVRRALAAAITSVVVLTATPSAAATPDYPDVDSLIDDSGPQPVSVSELQQLPPAAFATESGLVCRMRQGRITHELRCAGDIPGAPPDAGSVELPGIYGKASVPARFLPAPPDALAAGSPVEQLPAGHKIVLWDFSPAHSMVCGVPPSTDLVCVLKEPQVPDTVSPVISHGFVIAAPQSWVF